MDNQKLKEKFIDELKKKSVNIKCPICEHGDLVVEGPFSKTIQNVPGTVNLGGPSVPTLAAICKNCGFLREFALGSLGLLKDLEERTHTGDK